MKLSKSPSTKKPFYRRPAFYGWLIGVFLLISLIYLYFLPLTTLVLLQNTDEKRATGGFLGSIAVIDHHAWQIDQWQIYDIYESDGQIENFPPAPVAVQKYLMAGKNELHLPDSNWERDFPTSAAQIVDLFTRAGRRRPDFVVSLNLPVVETVLDKIGGLALPAAATSSTAATSTAAVASLSPAAAPAASPTVSLTSRNFAAAAHQFRSDFFPGDTQKTDFLRPAAAALQEKIAHFSSSQKLSLARFIYQQAQAQQLYFFSFHALPQQLFRWLGLSGETTQTGACLPIYFVESNVSVNKSNRLVSQISDLQTSATGSATLTVTWTNQNPLILSPDSSWKNRLHYGNYQRLLLPPSVTLAAATLDGQPLTDFDIRTVTDADDEVWQEIGFLLVINEQTSATLRLDFVSTKKSPANCWRVDLN